MAINKTQIDYLIRFLAQDLSSAKIKEMTKGLRDLDRQQKKTETSSKGMGNVFTKIAGRALLTIPVWMLLRTVLTPLAQLPFTIVKAWLELEKQMGRVATVTRGTEEDLRRLEQAVVDFTRTSTSNFPDATKVLFQLGSAGLSVNQQMAGLEPIMDLTIATFADAEQTAKLAAGAFNVFGNSLKGAFTDAQKFERITNVLANAFRNQQAEIAELSAGIQFSASVAGILNISFEELVGTLGFLNTSLLKGSKAGTSLLNAFAQLAQKSDQLADLGVIFDPSAPLNLVDVMDQLSRQYGGQAISLNQLKDILQVFGRRGGRAVALIIQDFERWKRAIGDTEGSFEDFATTMREQAENTLPAAFKKLGNSLSASFLEAFSSAEELLHLTELITALADKLGKDAERNQFVREFGRFLPPDADARVSLGQPSAVEVAGVDINPEAARNIDMLVGGYQRVFEILRDIDEAEDNVIKKKVEQVTLDKELERLGKGIAEGTVSRTQLHVELRGIIASIPGLHDLSIEKQAQIVNELEKELQTREDILSITAKGELTPRGREQLGLERIQRESDANLLGALGFNKAEVSAFKLSQEVEQINKRIRASQAEGLATGVQLLDVSKAETLENQNLERVLAQVGVKQEDIRKIKKLSLEITRAEIQEAQKLAQALRDAFSGPLSDFIQGESGILETFENIGDKIRDIIADRIAESLTDSFFDATGLDIIFGKSLTKQMREVNDDFIRAYRQANDDHINGITGGGTASLTGGTGGGGFPNRLSQLGLPGFGSGGFFTRPFGAPRVGPLTASQAASATRGQALGVAGGAALTGFSQFQAAGGSQGSLSIPAGITGGLGAGALGLSALGFGAGAGASGLAAAIAPLLGPIGIALGIGSLLFSGFSKKSQTDIDERTSTRNVASRVDVTNKKLDLVNRNLVAIKSSLDTFALPESSFFSEKRNLEDNFSIDLRRG